MGRTLLVIGATGDVGRGIVRAAHAQSWTVIAAGRDEARLNAAFADRDIHISVGDVATEAGALALWEAASQIAGAIDAVVVCVNAPNRAAPLVDWTSEDMATLLGTNLLTHFNAARTMLPRLSADGIFIGIGGGTADFIIPNMAGLSMAQAALRMMYRGFARERTGGAHVRELMIISMVNGASKRDIAKPDWVTDDEVGGHVCAIIAEPERFAGPILQLKSRDEVAHAGQSSVKD